MSNFNVDTSGRFPVKAWTKGVQVEDVAADQLRNMANMPFIHKHIAGEREEQRASATRFPELFRGCRPELL